MCWMCMGEHLPSYCTTPLRNVKKSSLQLLLSLDVDHAERGSLCAADIFESVALGVEEE